MGILAKYFCKEFFKFFVFCHLIFLTIFLAIDFIQKIDDFIEANTAKSAVLAYFLYKMPFIMVQMVPVAALISVIVMLSLMKKNNEITVLKASGVSVFRLSLPVVVASACLALVVFLFSELIVPYASSKSEGIWNREVKKRDQKRFYGRGHIWYRGDNAIYWIRHFDGKLKVMNGVTFYFFNESFHLIKRIEAQRAVWTGDTWRVEQGSIQVPGYKNTYDFKTFREMDLNLPERPEAFLRPVKRPEEMSYWQLKRFAEGVRLEGYNASRYLVDMNIKLAFPLISLVMVLIGIPITLRLKRGGTPLAVCVGIGVCFLFLVNMGFARSLGISGVLPPELAAWLANIIFLLFGIYLMMRLET
ncbi:MAG: LPS export ABC transporter permease LptG [Deltaproteobacteria bacterium]|nr:LPS export ABC transporter permease LptG [Deltaproteobacteria bacterium]